jgi:hypothetical protein
MLLLDINAPIGREISLFPEVMLRFHNGRRSAGRGRFTSFGRKIVRRTILACRRGRYRRGRMHRVIFREIRGCRVGQVVHGNVRCHGAFADGRRIARAGLATPARRVHTRRASLRRSLRHLRARLYGSRPPAGKDLCRRGCDPGHARAAIQRVPPRRSHRAPTHRSNRFQYSGSFLR